MHAWLTRNRPRQHALRCLCPRPADQQGLDLHQSAGELLPRAADPATRAETVAQLFLAHASNAASLHDHPGDTWTQDGYHGIGAFFARVEQKPGQPGEFLVSLADQGEIIQPLTKKTGRPMLPGVGLVTVPEGKDRREVFADWLTRADNPWFARVAVNRVWGQLLGRGWSSRSMTCASPTRPRTRNSSSRLAGDFIRDDFDLKKLTRTILRSRVYQLSSRSLALNQADSKYFSHANARLLPAEVLLDAICQVTGVPEVYPGRPAGTRATHCPAWKARTRSCERLVSRPATRFALASAARNRSWPSRWN